MQGALEVDRWLHIQLRVADAGRASEWYNQALGFNAVHDATLEGASLAAHGFQGARLRMIEGLVAGVGLELQQVDIADGPAPPATGAPGQIVGFALSVPDVNRSYELARHHRIVCDAEPVGYEGTPFHSLGIRDPDGLHISLVDYNSQSSHPGMDPGFFSVTHWLYAQIRVSDPERAISWYERMLGFQLVNDLHFEGPVYESSTGIPGVHIRLVQGFIGGVSVELVHLTSDQRDVAERIAAGGTIPAFTIGVRDVLGCYEVAQRHGVVCEGPPASFPPTPYHSMFVHDPDGTRIDLCDFEALPRPDPDTEPAQGGAQT
jgi:catechol 2,3-dioxygenase-like lactoylglutathione lyase family enzyme